MQIIDKIISNFKNSKSLYIGEKVTISQHMIQTAMLAEKIKCNDDLICSCLLHDYGHFIIENPDELVKGSLDGEHENIGYEYLKKFFKKEIVEPIKYHVLAKRYLAKDKKYFNLLSDASKTSLRLQGGVLNDEECNKFKEKKYFKASILLRKFDEAAKKTDIKMKSIYDYQKLLISKLI
ncbi:HD domain-containing protein [Candidatus Pelagibacter sp.]|nr:HD domain-containing protein [Candidatus Pelagibacter sp.]|tara:strand:- start:338 stop:874 length:537 start_codon:yes stop_codon:yes gene_type:complete